MARTALVLDRTRTPRPLAIPGARQKVLNRATAYWKASERAGDEYLRDLSGSGHDARFGSVGSARVMGGLRGKDGYLRLPGVAGNYASTPDHADLDITGDLDVRFELDPRSWSPATAVYIGIHFTSATASNWGVKLRGGQLLDFHYGDGSTWASRAVSSALNLGERERAWVRVTHDVDDGSGNNVVRFYKSSDGVTWTQVGSDQVIAGTVARGVSSSPLQLGAFGSEALTGRVFRAQVRDGIDGTVVFDADFTALADGATSFVEATGKTVTVNSASGADSNDPKLLEHDGEQYVYLPGVAGNYLSTPDSAALDITGDIDLRAEVALDDWTPAASQVLIAKRDDAVISNDYSFMMNSAGALVLHTRKPDDSAWNTATSTVAVAASDGDVLWVRATRASATGTVTFYTSPTGEDGTWTQLGATVATTAEGIRAGTAALEVGSRNAGVNDLLTGKVFRAQVYDGIDGTLVADFNAADASEPFATVTGGAGETWTFNRSDSGRKLAVVDRTMLLFGTDDYLEVADHDDLDIGAGETLTVVLTARMHHDRSQVLIAKATSTSGVPEWLLHKSLTTGRAIFTTDNGTNRIDEHVDGVPLGRLIALSGRRTADARIEALVDGSSGGDSAGPAGTLANSEPVRIAARTGSSGSHADIEFVAAAIFREALSDADLARVADELKAIA
jgi:hypothetical protein